jgi:hypothetical protein
LFTKKIEISLANGCRVFSVVRAFSNRGRSKWREISSQCPSLAQILLKEIQRMKIFAGFNKRTLSLAAAACLMLTGPISALAASKSSVLRVTYPGVTETGKCCFNWDQSLRVIEPERLVPIVVTWSTDYQSNAPFYSGLSVNGGPCAFYGPGNISTFVPADGLGYTTRTVQWLIMPGDYKLVRGANEITLCGGGVLLGY